MVKNNNNNNNRVPGAAEGTNKSGPSNKRRHTQGGEKENLNINVVEKMRIDLTLIQHDFRSV